MAGSKKKPAKQTSAMSAILKAYKAPSKNFKLLRTCTVGHLVVAEALHYASGMMIGVFHIDVKTLSAAKELNPHFSDDKLSPIAKFRASILGWTDAVQFAVNHELGLSAHTFTPQVKGVREKK